MSKGKKVPVGKRVHKNYYENARSGAKELAKINGSYYGKERAPTPASGRVFGKHQASSSGVSHGSAYDPLRSSPSFRRESPLERTENDSIGGTDYRRPWVRTGL